MEHNYFENITKPHINSFNVFLHNVQNILDDIPEFKYLDTLGNILSIKPKSLEFYKPLKPASETSLDQRFLPSEARLRQITYKGRVDMSFKCKLGTKTFYIKKNVGTLPIMIKSDICHTKGSDNVSLGEDLQEIGGYFIVNGREKLIRYLIVQKRNYVTCLKRDSLLKKGTDYTVFQVSCRSVKNEIGQTFFLHLHHSGSISMRIYIDKREFHIPIMLILKALLETTDEEIYNYIYECSISKQNIEIKNDGHESNTSFKNADENKDQGKDISFKRLYNLLCSIKSKGLISQKEHLAYIGRKFKVLLVSRDFTDIEAGKFIFNAYIVPHLSKFTDKFFFLIHAIKKLYHFHDTQKPDDPDSPMNHEVLTINQLFSSIIYEKVDDTMKLFKKSFEKVKTFDAAKITDIIQKTNIEICSKIHYLLTTGNLNLRHTSDIIDGVGVCIVAERINFLRFVSHFSCVNRGNFFAELKTISVRKLKPESYGFLCPVHTPDGTPCGIITHLSTNATITSVNESIIPDTLYNLGVIPIIRGMYLDQDHIPVLLNGKIMGHVDNEKSILLVSEIRRIRAALKKNFEVVLLLKEKFKKNLYPGVYIWTTPGRFTREVLNHRGQKENIGIMEQVFLNIEHSEKIDIIKNYEYIDSSNDQSQLDFIQTSQNKLPLIKNDSPKSESNKNENHLYDRQGKEGNAIKIINPTSQSNLIFKPYKEKDLVGFLSLVAGLTPFSDFNQSPRNMYQCQMAKQTMGTAYHNHITRIENKAYKIISPQSPLVSTSTYREHNIDEYPMGVNAVVAVVSYTSYDMEDAIVINKSCLERGFFHGCVYKTEIINVESKSIIVSTAEIGEKLTLNSILATLKTPNNEIKKISYKGESGIVDKIHILDKIGTNIITVTIRIPRNPSIGDKFCSRHGQKGVCSMFWSSTDMPFTEEGIVPDIIINPHAFPSRMTIGMLIESMAAKIASLSGKKRDGTTFKFNPIKKDYKFTKEKNNTGKKRVTFIDEVENKKRYIDEDDFFEKYKNESAVDYFGKMLHEYGFNYYGSENMYSGISGAPFKANVFMGIVYYQRLRHMVSDKYQVRTTGSVQALTRQPLGGRKNKGGVRLGEMEKDALIGHGVSYIIQDRLLYCSDHTIFKYCMGCKSILYFLKESCLCGSKVYKKISLPYVFKYLCSELAGMNIKVSLDID